jgi:hypothetical protein
MDSRTAELTKTSTPPKIRWEQVPATRSLGPRPCRAGTCRELCQRRLRTGFGVYRHACLSGGVGGVDHLLGRAVELPLGPSNLAGSSSARNHPACVGLCHSDSAASERRRFKDQRGGPEIARLRPRLNPAFIISDSATARSPLSCQLPAAAKAIRRQIELTIDG